MHQSNLNSALTGKKSRNNSNPMTQMVEAAKLQYKQIEEAAKNKFNLSDSRRFGVSKNPEVNYMQPPPDINDPIIVEPSIFLIISNQIAWSAHFDSDNKVYYHNRKTNKSTYEKPADFDAYDPASAQDNIYANTFNQTEIPDQQTICIFSYMIVKNSG